MLRHDCCCSITLSWLRSDFAEDNRLCLPSTRWLISVSPFLLYSPSPIFPSRASFFLFHSPLSVLHSISVYIARSVVSCEAWAPYFFLGGWSLHLFSQKSLCLAKVTMGSPVLCSRLLFISAPASLESPADQSLSAFLLSLRFLFGW